MQKFLICAALSYCITALAQPPAGLPFWRLTPEAEAYVQQLKKKSDYAPRVAVPMIFPRGQIKYSIFRDDYLHRWIDRPLWQNTGLQNSKHKKNIVSKESFEIMARHILDSGMAGLAFFPMTSSREEVYAVSQEHGPAIPLLTEFGNVSLDREKKLRFRIMKKAMEHPNSLRLDGKVVMTCYCTRGHMSRSDGPLWDYAVQLKKEIDERHGKNNILLCYAQPLLRTRMNEKGGRTDVKHIKMMEENLRKQLRKCDGLVLFANGQTWVESGYKNADFFIKVVVPVVHKVYSEPEFKGKKYLAMQIDRGHINMFRWNYIFNSGGTSALRESMRIFEAIRPDLGLCTEWDEENENTCFRPTLYNSISTMRIVRSVMQKIKAGSYTPMAGDDTQIPNLIISSRQSLAAGERLDLEVVNVPDGSFNGQKFTVFCTLSDIKGKVVHKFAPQVLQADRMSGFYFSVPVSKVLKHQLLFPKFRVVWKGGQWECGNSPLAPVELRANWNLNYKWIIQPLRNLPRNISAQLKIAGRNPDGTLKLKGFISSPKKFRTVEIHDGADVVFMKSPLPDLKEDEKQIVIRIAIQSLFYTPMFKQGKVAILNAPGTGAYPAFRKGTEWSFKRSRFSPWTDERFAAIPRQDIDKAEILIDFPGFFAPARIKVADIMKKDVIGVPGKNGTLLTAGRFLSQIRIPPHLMKKKVEFEAVLRPSDPATAVYTVVAIDEDYNVFRGAALSMYKPSGKLKSFPVFEVEEGRPGQAVADVNMLTSFDHRITPSQGSVISSRSGFRYASVLGGNLPMATTVGAGETNYGNSANRSLGKLRPGKSVTTPSYAAEGGGRYSLKFGDMAHWCLPMQYLFPYCGFEFKFKVYPETLKGKQALFTQGFNAFQLHLDGAVPKGMFFNGDTWKRYAGSGGPSASVRFTGPALKEKQWNEIVITWDCRNIVMKVNGVSGKPRKCVGFIMHSENGVFGRLSRSPLSLNGKIADASCRPLTK